MPFVSCSKFNQEIADLEQELLTKQNALKDCTGNPLAGTVPTCAQMNTAISQAIAGGTTPTGAAGGDLEGTYPNPTVKDQAIVDAVTGSTAVQTAVAGVFNRCNGTDMPAGASLIECSAKGTDIPYLVSGVIPATQLPAYVDDVLEFPALANFPTTGEAGKIYIDASTGKTYRWNGATYTEISASAGITVQDEGSVLTTAATSLNFVGAGVQATSSGGAVTVTVPSATYNFGQQASLNGTVLHIANAQDPAAGVDVDLSSLIRSSGGAENYLAIYDDDGTITVGAQGLTKYGTLQAIEFVAGKIKSVTGGGFVPPSVTAVLPAGERDVNQLAPLVFGGGLYYVFLEGGLILHYSGGSVTNSDVCGAPFGLKLWGFTRNL